MRYIWSINKTDNYDFSLVIGSASMRPALWLFQL